MTVVIPGMGLDHQRVPVRPRNVSKYCLSLKCNDVLFCEISSTDLINAVSKQMIA